MLDYDDIEMKKVMDMTTEILNVCIFIRKLKTFIKKIHMKEKN